MTDVADCETEDLRPILAGVLPGRPAGPDGPRDQVVFDAAIHRAWQTVYTSVVRRTGDGTEAEETAQEVFCRVLARVAGRPAGDAVRRAYLARAARNLLHDQWRRRQRRALADAAFARERASAQVDPEETVLFHIQAEELHAALRSLPTIQAQVLRLRVGEGLSSEETAALVGRSPAAVRQIQRRALQALRMRLVYHHDGGAPARAGEAR